MKSYIVFAMIILATLIFEKSTAQRFLMSSVGTIAGTSSNATALNFTSNANCIKVQTGVAVLNSSKSITEFAINCAIVQSFNTLGLKLFPNPVSTFTKAKFTNTAPVAETFEVSIWNTEGAKISSRKETGYTINQGILLDLTNLVSGSYFLNIASPQKVESIKFIKAN